MSAQLVHSSSQPTLGHRRNSRVPFCLESGLSITQESAGVPSPSQLPLCPGLTNHGTLSHPDCSRSLLALGVQLHWGCVLLLPLLGSLFIPRPLLEGVFPQVQALPMQGFHHCTWNKILNNSRTIHRKESQAFSRSRFPRAVSICPDFGHLTRVPKAGG